MKRLVPFTLIGLLLFASIANSQIITSVIKANFGVDADLRANYFNGSATPVNDDWFNNGTPGSGGFVIDTTGAKVMMDQYILDPTLRKKSFIRGMNYPMYSVVNGKLLYDAVYIRDHYKNDSSAFLTSNKNGDSPAIWSAGTKPVLDKNDLNDVMVHVRRDGSGLTDSLWFFAGMSLHGNNGSRYFDFELYQTDIYYDKTDGKFHDYGPDAGHTAWQFDGSGNITKPGDIIFTAEFGTASLTLLQARIWVDKSALSITPTQFIWGGEFDGEGAAAQFGYASILPITAGSFYGGKQSDAGTWAGPFGFIDIDDVFNTDYGERHFMEIAVNMTKIGLDPYSILGIPGCGLPFKRVFAKTRSSTSFTSELKDFVGPYRIAAPPPVVADADLTLFCGPAQVASTLAVTNPLATSTYTWETIGGNIISSPATGPTIIFDKPGLYIVTQTLFNGCNPYSVDTIKVVKNAQRCMVLATEDISFDGKNLNEDVLLNWTSPDKDVLSFVVERSFDSRSFHTVAKVDAVAGKPVNDNYEVYDPIGSVNDNVIYYRLKINKTNSRVEFSKIISVNNNKAFAADFVISPNPAINQLQVAFKQNNYSQKTVRIYNSFGHEVYRTTLKNDSQKIDLKNMLPGIYFVNAQSGDGLLNVQKKLLITR